MSDEKQTQHVNVIADSQEHLQAIQLAAQEAETGVHVEVLPAEGDEGLAEATRKLWGTASGREDSDRLGWDVTEEAAAGRGPLSAEQVKARVHGAYLLGGGVVRLSRLVEPQARSDSSDGVFSGLLSRAEELKALGERRNDDPDQ